MKTHPTTLTSLCELTVVNLCWDFVDRAEMETTFYHDAASTDVKKMKSSMTLDFNKGAKGRKLVTGLLASPDLNMLKLASPELERLIIAQNGLVTTTPTPTQLLFPKSVTEEQEAYARGFVDALAELHQKETSQDSMEVSNNEFVPQTEATLTTMVIPSSHSFTTTTTLPGSVLPVSQASTMSQSRTQSPAIHVVNNPSPGPIAFKEEPQTVPCLSDSPCMSPINMETQEVIKLDRKRARNRVAARKCRMRKLERIGRLEERVNELKDQNTELTQTASSLREQVCKLKQQIMEHVNSGCQVMLSNNLVNL